MDRREAILARLLEIATGIEGIVRAWRHKSRVTEEARPAIVILDADEVAEEGEAAAGRPFNVQRRVVMTPEIYIMLGGSPEEVGTEINTMRGRFLKAVLKDDELISIVGTNGLIKYEGCATGLAEGRSMEAEMGVSISFTYILKVDEL